MAANTLSLPVSASVCDFSPVIETMLSVMLFFFSFYKGPIVSQDDKIRRQNCSLVRECQISSGMKLED